MKSASGYMRLCGIACIAFVFVIGLVWLVRNPQFVPAVALGGLMLLVCGWAVKALWTPPVSSGRPTYRKGGDE